MHEMIAAALLLAGIAGGIWLNRRDFADLKSDMNRQMGNLKSDMNRQFDGVNHRLNRIEEDQMQFYKVTGELDGRLNKLSARVK